ncbi:purple acid phosphatase family protein [Aliidiomarina maris]|uniref:Phosphoesterase n=1 Tax=Aliidiomarina maris TaxID=531312 RepID=A0A327X3H4_9GAMM|nr:metallophosphoesterase family protein [Aliidiomarina maris]RAK01670.1 calcineurin-like phosphoesterase family protein [Aliidiomarina maris]RUO28492.1 phosphoesterase [Aliidiomarina maris]
MQLKPTYGMLAKLALVSAVLASSPALAESYPEANTLVPEGMQRYVASAFPDRIILLPGQHAATEQRLSWRTNTAVERSLVQLTVAQNTPGLHLTAHEVEGEWRLGESENGQAHHHAAVLSDLKPDTLYAYRVMGQDTWSEWFQFKTPKASFSPSTVLYFGDAQNAVLSHYARTVREAIRRTPHAEVMLYAGDLVNSRYGVLDDEWGEWFEATGWMGASMMQVPVTGNHEFIEDEQEVRHLVSAWPLQFNLPTNGPEGLQDTVYFTDYQGVRYIALDSTQAVQSVDSARLQGEWLKQVLADNPNQWTVVIQHHPMFSVSLGRDNPILRQYWQSVFEEFGVDIVLQGHDHTYGRSMANEQGPVYVVSVAGPKMYLVSENAEQHMLRNAEDVQLFQHLTFTEQSLEYRAYTVTGELYDGFNLHQQAEGANRVESIDLDGAEIRCQNPAPVRATRCWNGTELIHAPVGVK